MLEAFVWNSSFWLLIAAVTDRTSLGSSWPVLLYFDRTGCDWKLWIRWVDPVRTRVWVPGPFIFVQLRPSLRSPYYVDQETNFLYQPNIFTREKLSHVQLLSGEIVQTRINRLLDVCVMDKGWLIWGMEKQSSQRSTLRHGMEKQSSQRSGRAVETNAWI